MPIMMEKTMRAALVVQKGQAKTKTPETKENGMRMLSGTKSSAFTSGVKT